MPALNCPCRLARRWAGALGFLLLVLSLETSAHAETTRKPAKAAERELAAEILADRDLDAVLARARALLKTGLNAGSGYGEVWIRDFNTFLELSLDVNRPAELRQALVTFFQFQADNGDVPDGYIPKAKAGAGYRYRSSPFAPELLAHKNTVETDQESSLVLAVATFVRRTGDRTLLTESIGGRTVLSRLELALNYVLTERFDPKRGLIWGATTADWGDVQPEHEWGVELDESSHRACDIYDNALAVAALRRLEDLLGADSPSLPRWKTARQQLERNIRHHLWDRRRHKFRPHVYLAGSPFPPDFAEESVYFHGGTAVAIEAGLLSQREIARALADMRANVRAAGASSIGLTLYPPYPAGTFRNRGMGPYSYQNGGDWCWFGGRMVRQLARHGFVREAYEELKPMVARVQRHGDFHEWWTPDNQPKGSAQFRGSAGVLGATIIELHTWARQVSAAQ